MGTATILGSFHFRLLSRGDLFAFGFDLVIFEPALLSLYRGFPARSEFTRQSVLF